MSEIAVSHLYGENGVTYKIKSALRDASKQFIYIGFLLDEADRLEYYREGNYDNIYDYCEANFGFKKSSTNNFIRVYRTFGEAMYLQDNFKSYTYSQLTEMCSMNNNQLKKCNPTLTVRELRAIKKGNIVYSYSDDGQLDIAEDIAISEDASVQMSGKNKCLSNNNVSLPRQLSIPSWLQSKLLFLINGTVSDEILVNLIDYSISRFANVDSGYFNTNLLQNLDLESSVDSKILLGGKLYINLPCKKGDNHA